MGTAQCSRGSVKFERLTKVPIPHATCELAVYLYRKPVLMESLDNSKLENNKSASALVTRVVVSAIVSKQGVQLLGNWKDNFEFTPLRLSMNRGKFE